MLPALHTRADATTAANACACWSTCDCLLTLKDLQLRGVLRQHTVKLELVRLRPMLQLHRHGPVTIDPGAVVVLSCKTNNHYVMPSLLQAHRLVLLVLPAWRKLQSSSPGTASC